MTVTRSIFSPLAPRDEPEVPRFDEHCGNTLVSLRGPDEVSMQLYRALSGPYTARLSGEIVGRLHGKTITNIGCGTPDIALSYTGVAFEIINAPRLVCVDPFNLTGTAPDSRVAFMQADGVGFLRSQRANCSHVITASLDEEVFMAAVIDRNYGLDQSLWATTDRILWSAGEKHMRELAQEISRVIGDDHIWFSYCSPELENFAQGLGLRIWKLPTGFLAITK